MTQFDVVIIGAGINGAGLFRDLCEQGLTCLIVDKSDFGSGTSAAPSRLIHGGLKYLETGELRLVAQSTLERNLLLKNAPHLVAPLLTFIPIFSWTNGVTSALRTLIGQTQTPRSRGAILIKIGLALYDFYGARQRVLPRHRMLSRKAALADLPPLTPKIIAAATYYDARITAPERLVLELVQDGIASNPKSAALTYVSITARYATLTFTGPHGTTIATPNLVVNAAGPWIDAVNATLGTPTQLIGGTKGSHILLDHPALIQALHGRMIYFEADDGRILLVYDYLGRAMVGSTDIKAADPETVRCDADEIAYFLTSLRALLPGLTFDASQIVYAYSGIRPLPASDAATPGLISRDHSAPVIEATPDRPYPILSLIGGKWTTFRGFAEEVATTILIRLGQTRKRSTQSLTIGGGKGYPPDTSARRAWIATLAGTTGIRPERAEQLLARYGTTARMILADQSRFSDSDRLPDAKTYSRAEIDWIARNERVSHLADILMRRTTLAITGNLSHADIAAIADIAAKALNWDAARMQTEITAATDHLTATHRLRIRA